MVNLILSTAIFANLMITNSLNVKDTVKAEIYLDLENHIYIHVRNPVNQIFTFRGDTLYLYYPDDKKAFFFSNYNPMELPISKAIIGSEKNFDLSKYGFRFLNKKEKGDTVFTYWSKEKAGNVVIKQVNGKLKEIKVMVNEKVVAKTLYEDYVEEKGLHTPGRIHSVMFIKNGKKLEEDVFFRNVKFIDSFPDSLKELKIPKDVEVKGW